MSYLQMPVRSDLPAYSFQTTLEGKIYSFSINWNSRMDRWIMSISDPDGTPIVMGIVLLLNVLLTERYSHNELLPPGEFLLIDSEDGKSDPGRDDLGTRFTLLYRESTTPDDE